MKYQLKIKSLNKESLILYKTFLEKHFVRINIKYSVFSLPTKIKKITLLKSPHVNKSAREQFQIKRYCCVFKFYTNSKKDIEHLILINKPNVLTLSLKNL